MKNNRHQHHQIMDSLRHVLTGAMHEETCIPGVLRDNTERPVEAGSNVLAEPEAMIGCARSMLERGNRGKNKFEENQSFTEKKHQIMGQKPQIYADLMHRHYSQIAFNYLVS